MNTLIADTHVHLHEAFDVDVFLDAAWQHFAALSASFAAGKVLGILCLTDCQGIHSDQRLCNEPSSGRRWQFSWETEKSSVRAVSDQGKVLQLLPGRQIVSTENLELLALGSRSDIADRELSLSELVDCTLEDGALPVIPWGFGKWSGSRGQIMRELIDARDDFLLGDNGNRLQGSREPELLNVGRQKGLGVVAGSDPMPFRKQNCKAGSYAIELTLENASGSLAEIFLQSCLKMPSSWRVVGHLASPMEFFQCQIAMQIRKRFRKSS